MTQKYNFKFESATATVESFTNRSTALIAKSDNKTASCNRSFWVRCRGTGRSVRGSGRSVRQILPKTRLLRQETNRYLNVLNINF